MEDTKNRDELALQRTLLAADRTFSAWIRTGLAGIGGGLAVSRVLIFKSYENQIVANIIGALLVIWGACIFVYAIYDYRATCAKLARKGLESNSLKPLALMTTVLFIIALLVFWITLK